MPMASSCVLCVDSSVELCKESVWQPGPKASVSCLAVPTENNSPHEASCYPGQESRGIYTHLQAERTAEDKRRSPNTHLAQPAVHKRGYEHGRHSRLLHVNRVAGQQEPLFFCHHHGEGRGKEGPERVTGDPLSGQDCSRYLWLPPGLFCSLWLPCSTRPQTPNVRAEPTSQPPEKAFTLGPARARAWQRLAATREHCLLLNVSHQVSR